MMGQSKWILAVGLACTVAAFVTVTVAQPKKKPPKDVQRDRLVADLKEMLAKNLAATAAEDIDGVLATIHAKSPARPQTPALHRPLFARYDLKYEMLSFAFIGSDGKYAVARIRQKTTKIKGPEFRNNVLDLMHIFRKDEDVWKIWQSAILEIEYLDK